MSTLPYMCLTVAQLFSQAGKPGPMISSQCTIPHTLEDLASCRIMAIVVKRGRSGCMSFHLFLPPPLPPSPAPLGLATPPSRPKHLPYAACCCCFLFHNAIHMDVAEGVSCLHQQTGKGSRAMEGQPIKPTHFLRAATLPEPSGTQE